MWEFVEHQLNNNQFLSGGIGVALFSSFLFLCRKLPQQIYGFVDRNLVWTIRINNDNQFYEFFMLWAAQTLENHTKRIKIERGTNGERVCGLNYGTHWKWVNGSVIVITVGQEESQQSLARKDYIVFKVYSLKGKKAFSQIMKEVRDLEERPNKKRFIYDYMHYWRKIRNLPERSWQSIFLNKDTKDTIINSIEWFQNSRDFYQRIGKPFKYTILLYGSPGTGKSSTVFALANKLGKHVGFLDFSLLENGIQLKNAFSELPPNSIMVLEDVDCHKVTHDREPKKDDPGEENSEMNLSTILHLMDGFYIPDGTIIIATTNHIDKLDPAFVREGRFDKKIEIGPADYETARSMCMDLNPDKIQEINGLTYPVNQARLQSILVEND